MRGDVIKLLGIGVQLVWERGEGAGGWRGTF